MRLRLLLGAVVAAALVLAVGGLVVDGARRVASLRERLLRPRPASA